MGKMMYSPARPQCDWIVRLPIHQDRRLRKSSEKCPSPTALTAAILCSVLTVAAFKWAAVRSVTQQALIIVNRVNILTSHESVRRAAENRQYEDCYLSPSSS